MTEEIVFIMEVFQNKIAAANPLGPANFPRKF
jgi:hypothetical protein